ncbi:MAG: glycosyltransferase family 2 protein [Chlorobium sp.]|nr:MAG: glycosyltransferase family 2 protein [Chlorobium sp.]
MSPERELRPSVDVIIPHFRRHDMLERCLDSLAETLYPSMNIIVVDNGGKQAGLVFLVKRYRNARLIKLPENRGYAGGCNEGLKSSSADYVVFMNDDTIHDPQWLDRLVDAALDDLQTGALQPKILSMQAYRRGKKVFDYAGAAGGMSDKLGYPYCLGRVFSAVEEDTGRYDAGREIFWASGVAMFAKRSVVEELGGFDEDFFMHMEEIDLAWRMKLRGYHVRSVPSSVVIHEGGASLSRGSAEKVYLNHRNNIAMLLKNRGMAGLLWIIPVRLCLEIAAALFYLTQYPEAMAKSRAVMQAIVDSLKDFSGTMQKRRQVQSTRVVGDREIFRRLPLFCILRRKAGYIHQV